VIHYHGGPITPDTCALRAWTGRHAFVSFAHPGQIKLAGAVCQSFALDNGAFSLWRAGKPTNWADYYEWVRQWRTHPGFDFAVIPDVIEGSEDENDALAEQWPFARHEGAPVWHTNEGLGRLARLATQWPRVCLGSSGDYDVAVVSKALPRLLTATQSISGPDGRPVCKLHGLRMLNPRIFTNLPLASADSTNVARNIGLDSRWTGSYAPAKKETRAQILVERIESHNAVGNLPTVFD
jgi:hypothetical protein